MILDEGRTEDIPFDLGAYRVIKFKGELAGFGKLRRELNSFVSGLTASESERRDNPVHDWLPALPANALRSSAGSAEGELRAGLAKANEKIREYEEKYGASRAKVEVRDPLDIIRNLLADAKEGNLPSDLMERAERTQAEGATQRSF